MSSSPPEHPDLDQLRRQAKELRDAARGGDPGAVERFAGHHPSAPQGPVTLAAAQLVIAGSWTSPAGRSSRRAVDAHATTPERRAEVLVAASVEGREREAESIFDAVPDIAYYSLEAAAVLGDVQQVGERLAVDPGGGGRHRRDSRLAAAAVCLLLRLAPDRPWPRGRDGCGGADLARRRGQP